MGALLISGEAASRIGARAALAAPQLTLLEVTDDLSDADRSAVEVAYFSGDLFPNGARRFFGNVTRSPNLRWLHSMSAGVDSPVFGALRNQGVRITTSSGSAAEPIAQTVMLYVLALNKRLAAWADAQRRAAWEPHDPHTAPELEGSRMVVVGMGPIGLATARLAQAFGIEVVGVRRTVSGSEPCRTVTFAELDGELPDADHVVLAAPLTADTRLLFDAARLARIKRGAALYNVGRGELVDEPALISALSNGALGGAGLDVFATEPLPPGSPLWSMPNVIVTPHNSAASAGNTARVDGIFLDNLARYAAGAALVNELQDPPA